MPHLPQNTLNDLLNSIPDPKQRKIISDIATGKVVKQIICTKGGKESHPKNAVIGYIYSSGRIEGAQNSKGEMMLRSSRDRFDGNKGFECWCGNDTRIAEVEAEDIDKRGNPPTRNGLENILKKLNMKKEAYPVKDGAQNIDGFIIQEVA